MPCFWRHNWNKWEEFIESRIRLPLVWENSTSEPIKFTRIVQKRSCKDCGYIEKEEID